MSYFLYLRERLRGMSRALRNNPGPNTLRYISYSLEAIEAEIEALALSNMDLDEETRRRAMANRLSRVPLSAESRLFDAATAEGYEP
jgi:hypothetical protein